MRTVPHRHFPERPGLLFGLGTWPANAKPEPTVRRVLFQFLGIKIHSYPAMLYLGLVAGLLCGTHAAGLLGLDRPRTYLAMLLLIPPALLGSRLLYVLTHWDRFRGRWRSIWDRSLGGASLYGGLILALGVSIPLLHALDLPFGRFWDAAAITMLVGMIPTKVGCLLNGCCCGRPTSGPFAMFASDVHGVRCARIPSQLLEAAAAAVLLATSLPLLPRSPFPGALLLLNLAAYGLIRWILEFTREPEGRSAPGCVNRTISATLLLGSLGILAVQWILRIPAGP